MAQSSKISPRLDDRFNFSSAQPRRHAAWCPEGALIVAIFQVPNKFFEVDGRVDASGQDWDEAWDKAWDEAWGHTAARRARRN